MQIDKLKDLILYQSENTNKSIEVLNDNEDRTSNPTINNSTNRKIRQV